MRFLHFFHVCSFALLVIFLISDLGMVSSVSFPASRRRHHHRNVRKPKVIIPKEETTVTTTNKTDLAVPTPFGTAATNNGTATASGMAVAPLPSTDYFSFIPEFTFIKDACGLFNDIHFGVVFFGLLSCVFSTAMLYGYDKKEVLTTTLTFPFMVVKNQTCFFHSFFFGFITYRYAQIGFFLEKRIGLSFINDATLKFLRGIIIYFFSGFLFYYDQAMNFGEYVERCKKFPLIGNLVKYRTRFAVILLAWAYFAPFFAFVAFVLGGLYKFKKLA